VDPAWSPDGNWIAFRSDQDGGGIFITAASDGRQVRRVSPIGFGPQWSPDGTRILFRSSHLDRPRPTVLVVSRDGGQPIAVRPDIVSEMRLTGFGWHPDGQRVSLAGFTGGTGWTFVTADLNGNSAVTSTLDSPVDWLMREHGLNVGRFVWNRRGTRIFFEGQSHEATNIWAVHVNPSTLRWEGLLERLTTGAGLDRNLSLTADGRRLAFESASARTRIWAYRISPSTGVVTDSGKPITPGGPGEFDVAVAPDGDRLVFRTERDGRQELWQQSLVDGRLQRLLADPLHVRTFPRWSRDGSNLTYAISPRQSASPTRADVSLAIMPTSSDGQERIIQIAATGEIYPDDWSADGRQILGVCRVDQSDRTSVCVVPVSGNGPYTVLASDPVRTLRNARFSPDQQWFTFTRHGPAGVSTVCVRRISGGPIIELTEGTAFEDKAHWSPDGSRIYFVSNRGGVLNVWGRFFDQATGTPKGAVFQATHFNDPRHGLPSNLGPVDVSLTRDQLFVPITETTGQVWVLEDREP
jgi:Tol biopolymer transport system component